MGGAAFPRVLVTAHPVRLSVIVPALNEGRIIASCIGNIRQACGPDTDIIVVDGGSSDSTPEQAREAGARVLSVARGRASQMNAGAAVARGSLLLFLHADTRLPAGAGALVRCALHGDGVAWGRFDVQMVTTSPFLRLVALFMNLRSRLTGVATGDQAVFVRRECFEQVRGFPVIALMEDIAMSRALRALQWPSCLSARVTISGRRWQRRGTLRTILLMWKLRWLYYRGVSPDRLAQLYRVHETDD